jgi:hypothetical protein
MSDFGSRDDVGLADGLEGVDSEGVSLANLHDLYVTRRNQPVSADVPIPTSSLFRSYPYRSP